MNVKRERWQIVIAGLMIGVIAVAAGLLRQPLQHGLLHSLLPA